MGAMRAGRVIVVEEELAGSDLVGSLAAGATALTVDDPTDFSPEGGSLLIGEEELDYASADEETGVITLVDLPTVAYVGGGEDYVQALPRTVERFAHVAIDEQEETLQARIPHALYDKLPVGIRDEDAGEQELVELVRTDDGELAVADVVFRPPNVDGAFIAEETIAARSLVSIFELTSALLAGTPGAQRVELGYGTDAAGEVDPSFIGIRAFREDGVTTTLRVDAVTGEVYVKGRLDWGTASRLLANDILELKQQAATGFVTPLLVQSSGAAVGSPPAGGASSLSVSWPSPTTQGNLLLLAVSVDLGATITAPGDWTLVGSKLQGATRLSLFKIETALARSGAEVITFGSSAHAAAQLLEYAGTGAQDVALVSAGGNSTTPSVGPTATTTQASELWLAIIADTAGEAMTAPTNGFALAREQRAAGLEGATVHRQAIYAKNVTATGTASTAVTLARAEEWAALALTFKAKAVGTAAPVATKVRVYARDDPEFTLARLFAKDSSGQEFSLMGITRLAAVRLAAAQAALTLDSIPPVFRALLLVYACRSTAAVTSTGINMAANGATTGFDWVELNVTGGSAVGESDGLNDIAMRVGAIPGASASQTTQFGHGIILIPAYASAGLRPGVLALSGRAIGTANTDLSARFIYGTRRTAAAISRLDLAAVTGNLELGSEVVLYGIV